MRNRKPWVFARRRLFGWNVRLLTRGLQEKVEYGRKLEKGCAGRRSEGTPTVRADSRQGQTRGRPLCDSSHLGTAQSSQWTSPVVGTAQTVENSLKHKAARC